MKRTISVAMVSLILSIGAYSQSIPSLSDFQTSFNSFAQSIAGTLTLNSVAGSNWSNAYIGGFPHFGVAVTTGAVFAPSDAASTIFNVLGVSMPSTLQSTVNSLGLPVPAAVASLKIGLPFLPIDVGIKGGYIPPSVSSSLKSSSGIGVDYENIGLTVRYALVKQNILLPNISVGASYNYQKGGITMPTGVPSKTLDITGLPQAESVTLTSPDLSLNWTSNTVDFTAQVSKTLLFFLTPYLGVGYTIGSSALTGGLNSNLTATGPYSIDQLSSVMTQAGMTPPDFSATGLSYTATNNDPVLRLYGGFSLNILLLQLELQGIYVPAFGNQKKALGADFTLRVEL